MRSGPRPTHQLGGSTLLTTMGSGFAGSCARAEPHDGNRTSARAAVVARPGREYQGDSDRFSMICTARRVAKKIGGAAPCSAYFAEVQLERETKSQFHLAIGK